MIGFTIRSDARNLSLTGRSITRPLRAAGQHTRKGQRNWIQLFSNPIIDPAAIRFGPVGALLPAHI